MQRPLEELDQTIAARAADPSSSSYTTQLLTSGVDHMGAKISEEAAAEPGTAGRQHLIREAADLVYHLLVLLHHRDSCLADVETELARRAGVSGLAEKASRGST